MTELIQDGDYVLNDDGTDLLMTEHIPQILQTIVMHLSIRQGAFYPNKDYGTALRMDMRPLDRYALAYARRALDGFDRVYVRSAAVDGTVITFDIIIDDKEKQVTVDYENI